VFLELQSAIREKVLFLFWFILSLGLRLENLETINPKLAGKVKQNYVKFFKLSDEKINNILELINYGKVLPDIWRDHRETEYSRKIAARCDIDLKVASSIMGLLIDIMRRCKKEDFASKRADDLKILGFKDSDIDRFRKIAQTLRKKAAYKEIKKVDEYIQLSEEVLPRITAIECAFDIRCNIEKKRVKTMLPMILLKFEIEGETESPSKEVVFQADIGTIRQISRNLTKIYRNASVLREYTLQAQKGETHAE
jgi:hypothetical protein